MINHADIHLCYFTVVQNGFTPLHIGAKKNRIDIVLILLRRGMDPDVTTQVREYSALFIPTDELSQARQDFVFFLSHVYVFSYKPTAANLVSLRLRRIFKGVSCPSDVAHLV